jgi:hypothetical protein
MGTDNPAALVPVRFGERVLVGLKDLPKLSEKLAGMPSATLG